MIPKADQWREVAALASGDLGQTSYAVLLASLARSGRTVVLQMERKPVEKQIYFHTGAPVECRSNLAHEMFGRFLLSSGVISEGDHHSALSESFSREIPLGEILLERGLLTPHDIYTNLQKNLGRKLLDGFSWRGGRFEMHGEEVVEDSAIKVNTARLILTGVLKLTPQVEVDRALARLGSEELTISGRSLFGDRTPKLGGIPLRIVRLLEEQSASADELVRRLALPEAEVARILYALFLIGLVVPLSEVRQSDAPAAPVTDSGGGSTAGTAKSPVNDQALLLKQSKIVEAYLSFKRKDSFDFLGLEEGATPDEIEQRYVEAAETYAPWTLIEEGVTDFVEQAQLLFLKAAEAYTELKSGESRGALVYRRKVLRDEQANRKKPKFRIQTDLLDSEAQFRKGLEHVESGDVRKALEHLEFAVDCDSQNPLYRAELAYHRDRFEAHRYRRQSVVDLNSAVRIDPKCGKAHYYLGLILADRAQKDDLAVAEQHLRKAVKLMAPDRRPIDALKALSSKPRKR